MPQLPMPSDTGTRRVISRNTALKDEQPATADIFVSYAREELSFVQHLEASLASDELRLWFDVKGLFGGERFWDEIRNAIDAAIAVVFVITPESITSVYCRRELAFAVERQKRIVPVLRRDVADASTPSEIQEIQWVFLRDADAEGGLESLKGAIRADWVWLRQHARLLSRASEWASRTRDDSLLLRGHDLRDAQAWLEQKPAGRERPIPLQSEFVAASRRAAKRRRLTYAGSLASGLTVLGVVALLAADNYVADRNSRAREALDRETSENLSNALRESTRAIEVCRYIPLRTTECVAAEVNLGIVERALGRLEASLAALSRPIEQFTNAPPGTDADWALLAAARWERAVTTIYFAEAAPNEGVRSKRYALASADMSEAQTLFERVPEQVRDRPLAVTRARLMLAAGAYDDAREELERMSQFSAEKHLVLSLAYLCLGRAADASRALTEYHKALPGGSDSPQFKRELPFLERNSKCTATAH